MRYSTYTGMVRGVRDGDNFYITAQHDATTRRKHVLGRPIRTPRSGPAIVSYQGVAFAEIRAGRRVLPASWREQRGSHIERVSSGVRTVARTELSVRRHTYNAMGERVAVRVYPSLPVGRRITMLEHYEKEHL